MCRLGPTTSAHKDSDQSSHQSSSTWRPGALAPWRSLFLCAALLLSAVPIQAAEGEAREVLAANLVYARTKTSKCFSDFFLSEVSRSTAIVTRPRFERVRLSELDELQRTPFAIMNGEGGFTLTGTERDNLKLFLETGGFLIASAGCSDGEWSRCMRRELVDLFGEDAMVEVPMDHPVFHSLSDIDEIPLKSGKQARLQGIELDGRLVCLFSPEGLNNTAKVKGCCCCGGDEVKASAQVVANALVYCLVE